MATSSNSDVPQILVHSPSETRKSPKSQPTGQMELMKPPTIPAVKSTKTTGKEFLKQGHSMADWMRKIKNESVKGTSNRLISEEELKKHNKRDDGWMAIRGKVFNVTDYSDYHPGGISYILKNLGTDATNAFDAIHAYVNFENILRGRQVGLYMARSDGAKTTKNGFSCKFCKGTDKQCEKQPLTSMDQDDTTVMYKVEVGCPSSKNVNDWSVGLMNKQQLSLRLVTRPPEIWLANLKLSEKLTDDKLKVTFENNFKKLIVTLQKPSNNTKWKSIGSAVKPNNEFMDSRLTPIEYYPGKIVLKEDIGTSDILFGIQLGSQALIGLPVAWHVKIRVEGHEKPYTPVTFISSKQNDKYLSPLKKDNSDGQILFFVIKIYENGLVTPLLNKAVLNKPGGLGLDISPSRGSFDTDWLLNVDRLILVGGGTGFAPFVNIINWIKDKKSVKDSSSIIVKQIVLIFAASTLAGLIWDEAWEELANGSDWFYYIPYVSQPPDNWTKNKGRITVSSVQENLESIPLPQGKSVNSLKMKGMACGPQGFTTTCQAIFSKVGLKKSQDIFMFEG